MTPTLAQTLHAWMRVVMQHSMRNFILFAKEHNYSLAQLNTMVRLHYKGACGVSDLGEEMGVTSAAASQLLEKLVQQGLVLRSEDPQDRRNKRVALTEIGEKIVNQSIEARQGWLGQLADSLSPAEQERVQSALSLLIEKSALLNEVTGQHK